MCSLALVSRGQLLHGWTFQDEEGTLFARARHEGEGHKLGWNGVLAQQAIVRAGCLQLPGANGAAKLESFSTNAGPLGLMTGTLAMDLILSWNLTEAGEDKLFHLGLMHDMQQTTVDITLEYRAGDKSPSLSSRAFGNGAEASPKITRFALREDNVHLRLDVNFNKASHSLYLIRNGRPERLGEGKLCIDRDGNWLRARLAGPWSAENDFLHIHQISVSRVPPAP